MGRVRQLLILTAVMEIAAGLTLFVAPAMIVSFVFGPAAAIFAAVGVARLAGGALLALGVACWWARSDVASPAARALVGGLFVYNTAVVALGTLGTLGGPGPLQWSAVAVHAAQAIWCAWVLTHNSTLRRQTEPSR